MATQAIAEEADIKSWAFRDHGAAHRHHSKQKTSRHRPPHAAKTASLALAHAAHFKALLRDPRRQELKRAIEKEEIQLEQEEETLEKFKEELHQVDRKSHRLSMSLSR